MNLIVLSFEERTLLDNVKLKYRIDIVNYIKQYSIDCRPHIIFRKSFRATVCSLDNVQQVALSLH